MDTPSESHSIWLDGILDAVPDLELHELQIAYSAIDADLRTRFAARRSACDHIDTERGYIELERPPNRAHGCLHCLTSLESPDPAR